MRRLPNERYHRDGFWLKVTVVTTQPSNYVGPLMCPIPPHVWTLWHMGWEPASLSRTSMARKLCPSPPHLGSYTCPLRGGVGACEFPHCYAGLLLTAAETVLHRLGAFRDIGV